MSLSEQVLSALIQAGVIFALASAVYAVKRIRLRPRSRQESLFDFIGLRLTALDRRFWTLWIALCLFAVLSVALELRLSETLRELLTSESSPYGKILKNGWGPEALFRGIIYSFIQASLAEELLFRGLIAKRLFRRMSFQKANIFQSLIFWIMHLLIFRMITGHWISNLQLITFLTSFGSGLLFGYANERTPNKSILPSILLHGSLNLTSFLTLALLWPL